MIELFLIPGKTSRNWSFVHVDLRSEYIVSSGTLSRKEAKEMLKKHAGWKYQSKVMYSGTKIKSFVIHLY